MDNDNKKNGSNTVEKVLLWVVLTIILTFLFRMIFSIVFATVSFLVSMFLTVAIIIGLFYLVIKLLDKNNRKQKIKSIFIGFIFLC